MLCNEQTIFLPLVFRPLLCARFLRLKYNHRSPTAEF